jgi:hypothetical protein
MRVVLMMLVVLAATSAYSQYYNGWQRTDTVTAGEFDDYNPQLDHGGLGPWSYSVPFEWLVFERRTDTADEICTVRLLPTMSTGDPSVTWDSPVSIVSSTDEITEKRNPDICTIFSADTVTVAAWEENEPWRETVVGVWNIYYSFTSGNETEWSAPQAVAPTILGEGNLNVKVRPLSDSSFIFIWKASTALMFATFCNGKVSAGDTLVNTGFDSTEFDYESISSPPTLVWTAVDSSSKTVCLAAHITSLNPVVLSNVDTLRSNGNIGNPKFMSYYFRSLTFNVEKEGRIKSVLAMDQSSDQNGPWVQEDLAGDSVSDNLNAVGAVPRLLVTDVSIRQPSAVDKVFGFFAWERRTLSDTALVFSEPYLSMDTVRSLGYNRNPAISTYPLREFVYEVYPCVWQSTRTGNSHLYGRVGVMRYDAVSQAMSHDLSFVLDQNYPNPFNPSTVIDYQLPVVSHVTLKVYDVLGRLVATLVDEKQTAGEHSASFDARRLASGVYFCRLVAGSQIATRKMILLK